MASPFVPKGQEGLLVRNPISLNHGSHHVQCRLDFPPSDCQFNPARKQVAYFSRHNPHPERVFHIKGLLGSPICCVEDTVSPRMLISAPSEGILLEERYKPLGNTRYSANKQKSIPAVGIVPVTTAWRDELEAKAKHAIDRVLGKRTLIKEPTKLLTSSISDVDDRKVLEWLCRILQTDSMTACQEWLAVASEQEKAIVLNMIKMAAEGDVEFTTPAVAPANDYWYKYSSTPKELEPDMLQLAAKDVPLKSENNNATQSNLEQAATFKLPEHDSVIRSGSQLCNLAFQHGSKRYRAQSAGLTDLKKILPQSSSAGKRNHIRSQSAQLEMQMHMLPKILISKHRLPLQSSTQHLSYTVHNSDQ